MNRNQRIFVLSALCVIAIVLPFAFLRWSDGHISNATNIVVFYTDDNPRYPGLTDYWGVYTSYGILGLLLGLIAPIGLLAVAAYAALGTPPREISN